MGSISPGSSHPAHPIRFRRPSILPWTALLSVVMGAGLSRADSIRFAGKAVDGSGNPLPWALVSVGGTDLVGQTNADGVFSIAGTTPTGIAAQGRAASFPSPDPKAYRADGRPASLTGRMAAFPYAVAPSGPGSASDGAHPAAKSGAAEAHAAAADWILSVSMAHFGPGTFPQSAADAQGLILTLTPSSTDTAYEAEAKRACLDTLNALRASLGKPGLAWSASLEAFADQGARYDAQAGKAHGHFSKFSKGAVPADAENALPGWPLGNYRSMSELVRSGTKMMWDEGPGGGHYENIVGDHKEVGCGIYRTPQGTVWVIQDFK